jgi:CTP:molybdopterin cytidylyltransferase MocA
MSVAAVILAAGAGTRFTRDDPAAAAGAKLLYAVKGRPLVVWAIAPALEAGMDEVVVVDGAAELGAVMPEGVTLLHNHRWHDGQATSLQVALGWCARQGHLAAVIGLGDTPGLTPAAWQSVATAPDGPIVFATYEGRRGHPVRLDASVWPLLPTTGDEGARSLASGRPELVREVPCVGSPADFDTPEALTQWN